MVLDVAGGVTIRADRHAVWAALHDPACLKLCVPGCRTLVRRSERWFDLAVLVPLGPVGVVFEGTIEVVDSVPERTLVLKGKGQGGVAGLAAGSLRINLTESPSGCRLAYAIDAEPSGPVAAMGTLLLSGLAGTLVERFGQTFAALVGQPVWSARSAAVRGADPAS